MSAARLDVGGAGLELPVFLPDATRGAVRGVGPDDLAAAGVRAVCVNAFHLARAPGVGVIESQGGIRRFAALDLPVFSDSGGFQILSLAGQSEWRVSVTAKGLRVRRRGAGEGDLVTPEKSVEQQFRLGADALVCLDHCTRPEAPREEQERSVAHTLAWARIGRQARDRLAARTGRRPLLFAVVQGGADAELRRRCVDGLLEIGFDGYGFGGWPIAAGGALHDAVHQVAELLPKDLPLWGLGIGRPDHLRSCARAGYTVFDCTLPTRDARRGRIFVAAGAAEPGDEGAGSGDDWRYLYLDDERFRRDDRPLDPGCPCPTCARFSRAYLRHLREMAEPLADRLTTVHNLAFVERVARSS